MTGSRYGPVVLEHIQVAFGEEVANHVHRIWNNPWIRYQDHADLVPEGIHRRLSEPLQCAVTCGIVSLLRFLAADYGL